MREEDQEKRNGANPVKSGEVERRTNSRAACGQDGFGISHRGWYVRQDQAPVRGLPTMTTLSDIGRMIEVSADFSSLSILGTREIP